MDIDTVRDLPIKFKCWPDREVPMSYEELSMIPGVTPFAGVPNAVHWSVAGCKFNFVAAVASDGRHIFQINIRGQLDDVLCRAPLRARERGGHPRRIVVGHGLPGVRRPGSPAFECELASSRRARPDPGCTAPGSRQRHPRPTPFMYACAHGNFDTMNYLIDQGSTLTIEQAAYCALIGPPPGSGVGPRQEQVIL